MWNLPGPGIEPMSPALAGGFLTTEPPGKPPDLSFKKTILAVRWRGYWRGPKVGICRHWGILQNARTRR